MKTTMKPTFAPYVPFPGTPSAILVDIDGTVALRQDRGPYDMTRVGEDLPNEPVLVAVRAMHAAGHIVIFCSGRTEEARMQTEMWLAANYRGPIEALFMRADGDNRADWLVKAEIFDREIRDSYHVTCVFDDRTTVVSMWRSLGLTVFQVADGDF